MYRRTILLILISLAVCLSATKAQSIKFQNIYGTADNTGNASGACVQPAADGGYITTGYTSNYGAGYNDVWLVKTDSNGNMLWNKTYGSTGIDDGKYVVQTIDGGYAITGVTTGFGGKNAFIIKTDGSGNTVWSNVYGNGDTTSDASASCIQQTPSDSGYIIAGYISNYGAGYDDFLLVKTDAGGNILWSKTYGGFNNDDANYVTLTDDGGYAIVGTTSSFGDISAEDIYLVKTDAGGNIQWARDYGTNAPNSYDIGNSVKQTSDKGYIISGGTTTSAIPGGFADVLRIDSTGNVVWAKLYGTADTTSDASLAYGEQTPDGGYIFTGYISNFGAGDDDFYLLKLNTVGDTLWTRTYGGTGADDANSMKPVADGFIIGGVTTSYTGGEHLYLVKADASGNSSCNTYATHTAQNTTYILAIRSLTTTQSSSGGTYTTAVFSVSNGGIATNVCTLPTGVSEQSNAGVNVVVFPDPFSETATLQLSAALSNGGKSLFVLYDIMGNEVSRIEIPQGQQMITIERNDLAAGMYFYNLRNDKGVVNNGKLIIE